MNVLGLQISPTLKPKPELSSCQECHGNTRLTLSTTFGGVLQVLCWDQAFFDKLNKNKIRGNIFNFNMFRVRSINLSVKNSLKCFKIYNPKKLKM